MSEHYFIPCLLLLCVSCSMVDLAGAEEVDLDSHRRRTYYILYNINNNKFMVVELVVACRPCQRHYENVKGFVDSSHCLTHSMCSAVVCFRRSLAPLLSTLSNVEKISGCDCVI